MFQLAWRGVRHNTGRYIATLIAIMTGVAFFSATGFLSDRVINALEGDAARQYGGVGAAVVVDYDADGGQFADDLRIGQDVADQIAALPEVAAVGGDLTGSVAFLAPDGSTFADDATGRQWIVDDDLNPIDIDEGVAPVAAGEIAVDKGVAGDNDLEVGGNLIQTPGGDVTPSSNGDLVVEATSNTTLTFKLKGDDGTVRTGTITLS